MVEGATGMLAKLGVITFTEIEDKPTELVIRRLSDQEEADIQIEAERAGAGVDSDDDPDPAVDEAQP